MATIEEIQAAYYMVAATGVLNAAVFARDGAIQPEEQSMMSPVFMTYDGMGALARRGLVNPERARYVKIGMFMEILSRIFPS